MKSYYFSLLLAGLLIGGAYSPHLNKIETLWRKIKYEWLRPEAYTDFKTLKTAVWHILDRVGRQYTIQFAS